MTKRTLVWILILAFGTLSVGGILFEFSDVKNITFTEAELQEKLNLRLPMSKNGVDIKSARVNLADNAINLQFNAEGRKFKQPFEVSAEALGELVYDNINGTFYFKPQNIKLIKLQVRGGDVSDKVENFIEKLVDSEKIQKNKGEIGDKIEAWIHKLMEDSAVWVLQSIPVYKFPTSFKNSAIRMFLNSVEVRDGMLIAHLSIWQFTKMLVFYAIVLLAALATTVALIMMPEFGIAVILFSGW